jgi:alkylation response protein AidB-like acyl-CoA dehydrogenase
MASATGMVRSSCSTQGNLQLNGTLTIVVVQIFMEDVEVPKENMLPKVKGLKVSYRFVVGGINQRQLTDVVRAAHGLVQGPFTCLNSARYGISWGALGAACA